MAFRRWVIVSIIVLFLVVLLQNTQVVAVRFLFWEISMSQIILLPLVLLVGFAAGFVVSRITKKEY